MDKAMNEMEMTTEMPPMCSVFTSVHPTAAPPPPPTPNPPPTTTTTTPTTPPPPPPPTTTASTPPPSRPPTPTPPNGSSSPAQKKSLKLNKRKRKREDDCPPTNPPHPSRPTPPLNSPPQNITLNCRSVFPEEISKYIEFLRPGWEDYFSDGVMQFVLITAYRYAKQNALGKFAQWKKSKYDVNEMFNVTSLYSVEHVRQFTEHAMKVIIMHAALTACHIRDAPPLSKSTMEMVRQVMKFDYTVDGVGLAMMCDGLEQISTTNFLQIRHNVMLASGEEDNDMSFPFRFEVNKYAFNGHY